MADWLTAKPAPFNAQTLELRALPDMQQIYACMASHEGFIDCFIGEYRETPVGPERKKAQERADIFVMGFVGREYVYDGLDAQYGKFLRERYSDVDRKQCGQSALT